MKWGDSARPTMNAAKFFCAMTVCRRDSGSSNTVPGRAPFNETSPGLDHLSFAVPNRMALEQWCARFDELGVAYSPVASARSIEGASVVVFRDPDNIQLELFVES